ncbi:unnamed protein product [Pichia kudriavzevii]
MISAIFILDNELETIVSRVYREDVSRTIISVFASKIHKETHLRNPILTIGSTSFIHWKSNQLWYVVVTRHNSDAAYILTFLESFVSNLESLVGPGNDSIIINKFPIYQILDKIIDHGFVVTLDLKKVVEELDLRITKSLEGGYKKGYTFTEVCDIGRAEVDISNVGEGWILLEVVEHLCNDGDGIFGEIMAISKKPAVIKLHIETEKYASVISNFNLDNIELEEDVTPVLNYQIPDFGKFVLLTGARERLDKDTSKVRVRVSTKAPLQNVVLKIPSSDGCKEIAREQIDKSWAVEETINDSDNVTKLPVILEFMLDKGISGFKVNFDDRDSSSMKGVRYKTKGKFELFLNEN